MSMHWYIPVDDLFQQRVLKEPAALKTILNKEHTSTINEVENVRLTDRIDVQKIFYKGRKLKLIPESLLHPAQFYA